MRVLGIDTSCDDTAAAIVEAETNAQGALRLRSNEVSSQATRHAAFGGVVPEIAAREHLTRIVNVVQAATAPVGGLAGVQGIAVTCGPGLVGCLLIGLQFAKGLALARKLPWLGVNHLEGHLSAACLADSPPTYPHMALLVSGGHTLLVHVRKFGDYTVLGSTRDDAAGEAFDKVAKMLGLGYPGGIVIERLSQGGDPNSVRLPRALPGRGLDFSFSGLKTAALGYINQHREVLFAGTPAEPAQALRDFCAALQEAIADALTRKAVLAATRLDLPGIVLAGGVAANQRLRALLAERCAHHGLWSFAPSRELCTDNAGMIAAAGWHRLQRGEHSSSGLNATSRWSMAAL